MAGLQAGLAGGLRGMALLAALCACLPAPALAEGASAPLAVTATVREHLTLRLLTQPLTVAITEEDLARGFVDVPAAAQLAVRSNSRAGYALVFEGGAEFLRATLVRGLGREVSVGPAGGMTPMRPVAGGTILRTHELGFRFLLSRSARAGVHPWPLSLSVIPL